MYRMSDFNNEFENEFANEAAMTNPELHELCVQFKKMRDDIKALSDQKSALEKEKDRLEMRILHQFEVGKIEAQITNVK